MKMKQFNLKEYLDNPNRKIITRDGEKVRIICIDRKSTDFPIIALCTSTITGEELCRAYNANGACYIGTESTSDLMFAPQKHEYWVNVYKNKDIYSARFSDLYTSEQEAQYNSFRKAGDYNYVTTARIEWEE
jgi:hypothetical protein